MANSESRDAEVTDLIEEAHTKSLHLHELLTMITGEGGEVFHRMNNTLQDNFIWACQRIAQEMVDLAENANREYLKERVPRKEVHHG